MPKDLEKSAVSVTVEEMADQLVGAEMRASRLKRPFAQREVSMRAGVAPSAIENFQRGRLKHAERISGAIKEMYAAFLMRQIAGLELDVARARAVEPARDFRAAEAAIEAARKAIQGERADFEERHSR